MTNKRKIEQVYQDPVELIWIAAAREVGIRVVRDPEVFAAWDGTNTLRIGTPETLDADDSLAQMILHEICHWMVEGPQALNRADWGLDYDDPLHAVREHACLRLQSALADRYGLRKFLASTTDFREYFDLIGEDPLDADDDDPAIELAVRGLQQMPAHVGQALEKALEKTRQIAAIVADAAPEKSLWTSSPDSLDQTSH